MAIKEMWNTMEGLVNTTYGDVELHRYFDRIYSDNKGTTHLVGPKMDYISEHAATDQFAGLLAEASGRGAGSDAAIGRLIDTLPDLQVVFDDIKYPENILLNVIFNIVHKPFIPGQGVGQHMTLGLKQALQRYIRGLLPEECEAVKERWGGSINLDRGTWTCDLDKLEAILRYVEDHRVHAMVMELNSSRKSMNWTDEEMLQIFNSRAEELNERNRRDSDMIANHNVVLPLASVKTDGGIVEVTFEATTSVLDAIGHGIIPSENCVSMWKELNDMGRAQFSSDEERKRFEGVSRKYIEGDDDAFMCEFCPPAVCQFEITDEGACHWTERHQAARDTFMNWMNDPASSPAFIVLSW